MNNRAILTYLPSKKFLITLGVLLLLIGAGWFLFSAPRDASHQRSASDTVVALEQQKAALTKDSDGDGLKDWEEVLWKTDPHNPDTDGDGTSEGEEVRQGRNPLKPGPDDRMATSNPAIGKASSTPSGAGDNLTQLIARNFTLSYIQQKMANGGKPLPNKQQIADDLFKSFTDAVETAESKPLPLKFAEKDFTAVADSREAVKTYLNNLGHVFLTHEFSGEHETDIIRGAMSSQDFTQLKKLEANRQAYREIATAMKTVSVPRELLTAHTALANSFWNLNLILGDISRFDSDLLVGVAGLRRYSTEAQNSLAPLHTITQAIGANTITFQDSEPGAMFNAYRNLPPQS